MTTKQHTFTYDNHKKNKQHIIFLRPSNILMTTKQHIIFLRPSNILMTTKQHIIFLRPSNILLLMTTIKKIIAQSTAYGKRQCHLKQLVKKRNIKKLKKALHLGPSIEGKRKKD
jgi:hypothetical protein